MMYGQQNQTRILASPGAKATCPLCNSDLIPKCGEMKIWHWAHRTNQCDVFKEHETAWHRSWKEFFPEENREVIITKHGDLHIADVVADSGLVIEFQNSSISYEKIHEREKFYDRMVWVFNCEKGFDRIDIIGVSIQWLNPRRDYSGCRKPTYLDLGNKLLLVQSIDKDNSGTIPDWTITGTFISKRDFLITSSQMPDHMKIFRCNFCKRKFTGHPVLYDIIYRIDDDCQGSVDDLIEITGIS